MPSCCPGNELRGRLDRLVGRFTRPNHTANGSDWVDPLAPEVEGTRPPARQDRMASPSEPTVRHLAAHHIQQPADTTLLLTVLRPKNDQNGGEGGNCPLSDLELALGTG